MRQNVQHLKACVRRSPNDQKTAFGFQGGNNAKIFTAFKNTIDKISQNIGILQTNFLNAMAELEISEVKKRVSLFDLWTAVGLVILILTMIF